MSRPINSINKSGVVQSSSILQVISTQGPSTVTIAGGAATLSLDSLYVKDIYLLDTLHAKLNVDTNSPDKLTITRGSITNQVISDDTLNEVISFNNVSFEPDLNFSNIVSVYTDNALKLGKLGKEVDIISSNINFFSDKTLFIHTDSNIYGNLAVSNSVIIGGNLILGGLNANEILAKANINGGGNITIKDNLYVGGNIINISNIFGNSNVQINFLGNISSGTIEYKPMSNIFDFNKNMNIQGNLKVTGNLIIINDIINSNITIFENSNIIGNLTIEDNLFVFEETQFLGNLIVNQSANVFGNLTCSSNIYAVGNIVILQDLWVGRNFYLRENLQADTAFFDRYFYTKWADAGRLTVQGNANIAGNLLLESNLHVLGDANIGGNLIVNQSANVFGNLTCSSNIYAVGNIVILQDLWVGRNFYLRENLQADTAFFDRYFYTKWADAGRLSVQGNANIAGNLLLESNLSVLGDSNIYGNLTTSSNIYSLGNIVISQDLYVGRNFYLRENLQADTAFFDTYFYTKWADAGRLSVQGNANIAGNLLLESNLSVLGDSNIYGNLTTSSNIYSLGNIVISQDLYVGRNFYLRENLQADTAFFDTYFYTKWADAGRLSVRGNANIDGNLLLESNLNVLGDANIGGNLLIWSNLDVLKDANIGRNLTVTQDGNIGRDLTVNRNLYVNGDFILDNAVQSNTAAIHSYFYTSNANIGNVLVEYEANIVGNLIIGSNLRVLKDANIVGNLIVNKDANIYGNITSNNIIIYNELILNNNILIGNTNLKYNSNTVLSVDSSNIINLSNIIIVDPTNLLDVLLEVRGNISCNSLFLTSNVEKKKNIREISENEIERLNIIKSYNFDLKSNDNNNYGFLAHEVQGVYPILSNGDSVNYIGFIPLLLEKIKILENKIILIEKLLIEKLFINS